MAGPAWQRTLLVWLYDEHGGYYDHVAPPAADRPDAIAARHRSGGPAGRLQPLRHSGSPSSWSAPTPRPHDVTNVVHDHTSVLATIEQQWNLPALTYRDANAATLADFLDPSVMSFAEPPDLAAPANPLPGLVQGYQGQPVRRPPPPPPPAGS